MYKGAEKRYGIPALFGIRTPLFNRRAACALYRGATDADTRRCVGARRWAWRAYRRSNGRFLEVLSNDHRPERGKHARLMVRWAIVGRRP